MSDPERDTASFSASDSKALEEAVARFQEAWQAGQPPDIDDFLPDDPDAASKALTGLVRADLEHRLQAGEAVRIEQYLERYPKLNEDTEVLCELVLSEKIWIPG